RFHIGIGSAASALLSTLGDVEIDHVLQTAPADVWARQTREHVWQRVRECRQTGLCKDLQQQHASICAVSALLWLTPDTASAVTVVGWPDEFGANQLPQISRTLLEAVASMQQLLGVAAP